MERTTVYPWVRSATINICLKSSIFKSSCGVNPDRIWLRSTTTRGRLAAKSLADISRRDDAIARPLLGVQLV